ncbi:DNA damage-inducible protein 1 [Entomophthora muscae]|uniref:DNA damage-inducible protein 1 n=1 Tax=Entomophthora muscae TaxID=34485 RepID=A0ACC2TH07_9FUNG|nr:DNA damage-inducible protein 1 [Entomophthora muscae]
MIWYATCASVVTPLDPPILDQTPAQSPTIQDAWRLPLTTTSPCQNLISPRWSVIAATRRAITPLVATQRRISTHYPLGIQSTGKSQCGVEEELSTSTQSTNVPPDLLLTPDTRFLRNALHQVLVNDVHMVQTLSKVQASQEATKEVSKPYACQLLDNTPDTEPQHSGDATPLRSINVAIPMEKMKDHHPELCDIIVKFLSTADNLDIHLVNNIRSSYSECTYTDIFVNKLKVRAIINTGALINIVSSKLIQQMGLAPDIDHKKSYVIAGLDCTIAQGAYSALPLHFGSLAVSAPAIVLPNENNDILIETLFMRQYGVKTDLKNNILEILGQAILLYYNQTNPEMGSQTTPYVNLTYCNGVVPVKYCKLGRRVKHLPLKLKNIRVCHCMPTLLTLFWLDIRC